MRLSRSMFPVLTSAALGAAASVACALPADAVGIPSAPPPAGAASAVTLGGPATLDADGAVVFVPVEVACKAGPQTYLIVSVTESAGSSIASGTAYVPVDCTGSPQTLSVAVNPAQKAFRKGTGFGSAAVQTCDTGGCQNLMDQHVLQIAAKVTAHPARVH